MHAALRSLLVLSLLSAPLGAQQVPAAYLVRPASPEHTPRAAAPPIRGQFLAGFAGMVVGAAFGGSALGLLGGPLMWVTVPLGSRWLYNRSRTDTAAAP